MYGPWSVGILLLLVCACRAPRSEQNRRPLSNSAPTTDSVVSRRRPNLATYDIEQLVRLRWTLPLDFSPNSHWILISSNSTGMNQLWKVPLAGGQPINLTSEEDAVSDGLWAPDSTHIVFNRDYGGNEQYDVFLTTAQGGKPQNLTQSPKARDQAVGFSEDGGSLAYVSDAGKPGHFELWLYDLKRHAPRKVTSDSVSTFGAVWSHDDKMLALTRTNDFSDVKVVLYDLMAGRERLATPAESRLSYSPAAFSPDDSKLLLISDAKDSVPHLAILDISSGAIGWPDTGPWEVLAGTWTKRGQIAYSENADGRVTTYLMRPDGTGRRRVGPTGGATFLLKSSRDGRYLLLNHSDATRPRDVWIYDIQEDSTWQVTNSLRGVVQPDDLAPAALVHYPTYDGRKISAFVLVPFNLERDSGGPAVVMPHGGPSGQYMDTFSPDAAYFTNHGYVVIRPNVRGSTGYGKAFEDLNNRDWGGGDLKDLVAAADYLASTGYVARDKIAVMGGSYGGYLTLAALAFAPDRWAAGVDYFGISSVLTLWRTTDPTLRPYLEREMGTVPRDEGLMVERSPITHADSIRAPLLILQGDNDPRVPLAESRQIADAIRKRGGVAELVVYKKEGHGFAKLENRLDSARRGAAFLDRYVKKIRRESLRWIDDLTERYRSHM